MMANATYLHRFGKWETTSNVSYNQNVQTMLALYTQSGMSYGAGIRRQMNNGLAISLNGGGGRSVFVQQTGSDSHSEMASAAISWLKQTISGSYSESSGTSVLTTQGLVLVTTPGLLRTAK